MVTPATSHLDPPKSWEEFEEICADLFSREWQDNNTTRYGRTGQRQNGVDIYGRPGGKKYAAVQCKGRSKWPPDTLTADDIDAEVAKAKKFTPKLAEFVIATVDPNGKKVQDHARKITERHAKQDRFSVHVAQWPEITRRLTQHSDLVAKHYGYISNAEIKRDVKELPDRLVKAMRQELASLRLADRATLQVETPISAPSIADALERDLAGRYDTVLQRSLFPEAAAVDEFQSLADAASDPQYASVTASLRRRVLLRAARSASVRGDTARGQQLLELAQNLFGPDSDLPARARLVQAAGDIDGAISILRDQKDPDSRSTLLNVLFRSRGPAAAMQWFNEERLDVSDLTANGVQTLYVCHLQLEDIDGLRIALGKLTSEQLKEAPIFYFVRATVNLASVLPVPEQGSALTGLPLEVTRAHVVLPDATASQRLDSAIADLRTLIPLMAPLGLREAKRLADAYLMWCELLHPHHKVAGIARLREEMNDPISAATHLQFAFAYDPAFKPDDIASYLQRREKLGGLDDNDLRAMLVLHLHGDNASAIAKLIADHRSKLEAAFPALSTASIEIQALAKSGQATAARQLLEQHRTEFAPDALAGLETEVAKAEGADPVEQDLSLYETTGTTEALRSLLATVAKKGDHRAVAKYSEELFRRTNDSYDLIRAALALRNLGDTKELIRIMDAHPIIGERQPELARAYGWQLLQIGRLKDAKAVTESLRTRTPPARDLQLEIAVAIEAGEWETLDAPLAAFLEDATNIPHLN